MNLIPWLGLFGGVWLSGCGDCSAKKTEPAVAASASASASAVASAAPSVEAVAPSASATASASAAPTTTAAAAPDAGAAKVANSELPKPCVDGMGRLGHLSFFDLGGGRIRVASDKNASAMCKRIEPTKYQCDWIVDGKPTGSFVDKFDPAKKDVGGSIAKGKMFTCPPSSQN